MATKLDNDLAKHTANFGYNAVDSLYIKSNGFTAILDGILTANRTLTIPDNSGTLALTSDLLALGGLYLPLTGGTLSGRLIFSAAGNVNSPAIEFVDAKLGLYRHGSNHLRLGVNGTAVQGWQETYIENLQQVRNIDGTVALPAVSFANYTDAGMYIDAKNTIGFSTVGTKRMSISDVGISATLPVKCDNHQSNGSLGTAGNTVYGSTVSTLGMYFGLNRINFSTNSVERLNIQDTAITASQPVLHPNGTGTNCGIAFSSEVNTGMYISGSALYFAKGATSILRFQSSEVFSDKAHNFTSGSATFPAIRGASYSTTGLYWEAGPILNISVNGTQRVGFETGGLKLYGSTSGNNTLYVPSGLQYYQEETITPFTFTFGTNTQTATIQLTRIGRTVHFSMDQDVTRIPSGAISSFSSTSAVPLQYRPTSLRKVMGFNVMIDLGGTKSNSYFSQINTDGTFLFTHIAGTTSSAQHTLHAFTCSWTIAP